ncbi:hypothetical protein LDC_0908, partial [sediment metagenome]
LRVHPSPLPAFDSGETAEHYLQKLLPHLLEEFSRIRNQFIQLPIIPYEKDPPRSPFEGMTRNFSATLGGWAPKTTDTGPTPGPDGIYVYLAGYWRRVLLDVAVYYHV